MRRGAMLLAVAAFSSALLSAGVASAQSPTPITPERSTVTSAVTNCMMKCNSVAAQCQSTCVIPGGSTAAIGASSASGGTTSIGSANTSCQMACTTTQLSCQSICSQQSPSR